MSQYDVVDRRPSRNARNARNARRVSAPNSNESKDGTKRGMSYVPHSHGSDKSGAERVFCGLATARPLPVGIVEREMHCRVSSDQRKCTDLFCFALLILTLAVWAGAAVFVIPRSNWRRLVYGTDSLGRTCGEGDWEDRKRLFFPTVQSDIQALQASAAASSTTSSSSVTDDGTALDVYTDLKTSVCVAECPLAGEVVCLNDFLANFSSPPDASVVEQCYGGPVDPRSPAGRHRNTYFMDNRTLCESCWVSSLNTTDVFFHCVQDKPVATSSVKRCTFPSNPDDPADPDHLDPDDPRCLVVHEVVSVATTSAADLAATTGIAALAGVDPVAQMLAAALTGLPGWCLDVINTYAVMLGVAPIISGLVCFLSLISIGRACICTKRGCACAAGSRAHGNDAAAGRRFCSGTSFFVWSFLCFGLVLALAVAALAWLKTGLFNLDAAAALLDNSTGGLEATISAALGGFKVNVTDLGLDLFAGSLSELSGVQVPSEADHPNSVLRNGTRVVALSSV